MAHRILLADCDAMFCAVARREDPEGAGRAAVLVVGGHRQSRGVVCSASYEARAFGIRSGMPIARAAQLCPHATFVPVPRQACSAASREVRQVLEDWAPVVEPASIDEFYLGMDGTEALYRHEPLDRTAARIRDDVMTRAGLPVSIGGGTNRLVAKLAVRRAKPGPGREAPGVHVVPEGEEAEFVAGFDLAALPGVGPRLTADLHRKGLVRVTDALACERWTLEEWLGVRTGRWLYDRIRGRAGSVVQGRQERKSVSHERTFAEDIEADAVLEVELLRLTGQVCRDLRRAGLTARTVTVKLRDFDFSTRGASRTLPAPVSSDRAVLPVARELLDRLRRQRRRPVRLLGIALSQLGAGDGPTQFTLFGGPPAVESATDRTVAATMDRIRQRFGPEAIRSGRLVPPPGGADEGARPDGAS